jgi:hypothetical protein
MKILKIFNKTNIFPHISFHSLAHIYDFVSIISFHKLNMCQNTHRHALHVMLYAIPFVLFLVYYSLRKLRTLTCKNLHFTTICPLTPEVWQIKYLIRIVPKLKVSTKIKVLRDVTPCCLVGGYRRFGWTCRLYVQAEESSPSALKLNAQFSAKSLNILYTELYGVRPQNDKFDTVVRTWKIKRVDKLVEYVTSENGACCDFKAAVDCWDYVALVSHTNRVKLKYSAESLFQCHFIHHKFHMDWLICNAILRGRAWTMAVPSSGSSGSAIH